MHRLFRNPLVPLSFFLAILFGNFLYALTHLPAAAFPLTPRDAATVLIFNQETIRVMLATTAAEQKRGLSGRSNLAPHTGMLFVFERSGEHPIWMKEMNFPVDILWLDQKLRVVSIKENALPESFPEIFRSSLPAYYVLEVPAGFVREETVIIGSQFKLKE